MLKRHTLLAVLGTVAVLLPASLAGTSFAGAAVDAAPPATEDYDPNQMYEDLFYEITDQNEIRIVHALQSTEACEIPETIEGLPVTEIGDSAFAECYFLTKIQIADSVQRIGQQAFSACSKLSEVRLPAALESLGNGAFDNCSELKTATFASGPAELPQAAFYDCAALEQVTLPQQLVSIGKEAFHGCTALRTIALPDSLTEFSDYVFEGCTSLEEITLPAALTTMGNYVFESCGALREISVADENPTYCDQDGILFSRDGVTLIKFPDACPIEQYTVPDGCTRLENWSFLNASGLHTIDLNQVTSIGEQAFFFCTSLEEITIPDPVETLEGSTFAYCSALRSITLPEKLQSIGDYCFYACGNLSEVAVPSQVQRIGTYAFFNCVNMKRLSLPDSIEQLGDAAFGYYAEAKEGEVESQPQRLKELVVDFHRNPVIYDYVQQYGLQGTGSAGFPWWIVWTLLGLVVLTGVMVLIVQLRRRAAIPKPVPGGRLGSETKRPEPGKKKGK